MCACACVCVWVCLYDGHVRSFVSSHATTATAMSSSSSSEPQTVNCMRACVVGFHAQNIIDLIVITSAKEVMFSSLFVCLSVCLSVSNFAQKLPKEFA